LIISVYLHFGKQKITGPALKHLFWVNSHSSVKSALLAEIRT